MRSCCSFGILLAAVLALPVASAQSTNGAKSSANNVPGARYPLVVADGSITFSFCPVQPDFFL